MLRRVSLAPILLAALVSACARSAPAAGRPADPSRTQSVRLVLLVTVDQFRPDYLDRFGPQLSGGLGRIARGGMFFTHAVQQHAYTETAPGHSALLSGREPVHTNIVTNDHGVVDPSFALIDTKGEGASPARFRGTTLVDWMVAADSATRVLSVSRKDRAAILPIGRMKAPVFWFAGGRFTTSRYYGDALPGWVKEWNAGLDLRRVASRPWTLLLPDSAYPERDDYAFEGAGREPAFPHPFPADPARWASAVEDYPVMDSLTLDFAWAGVRALDLGSDAHPDVLAISLSTTDAIGHAFGPDSREIHDQVVRLDRWLGTFLDSLATRVPASETIVVLTADHGIASMPEYRAVHGDTVGGRVDLTPLVKGLRKHLEARLGSDLGVAYSNGLVWIDPAALGKSGLNPDSLSESIAKMFAAVPGVARVFTPRSLAATPLNDTIADRFRRNFPPDFVWLAAAAASDGWLFSGGPKGEHGTFNGPDETIPIVFAGPGIAVGRVDRRVASVDIAPTLARILGLTPSEPLDGSAVDEVLGGSGAFSAPD